MPDTPPRSVALDAGERQRLIARMRHLLLTGATGGIGQALALVYAGPGWRLTLCGRDTARLVALCGACQAQGAVVTPLVLDVRDGEAVARELRAADDAWPVDTVIAGAGVSASVSPEGRGENPVDVRRLFGVNALGAAETLSALAERLRLRGAGRLAVISSLGGYHGSPFSPAYSASKAAARVYGEALRGWLAPYGVTVTVVCPGFVDSPMAPAYGPWPSSSMPTHTYQPAKASRSAGRDRSKAACKSGRVRQTAQSSRLISGHSGVTGPASRWSRSRSSQPNRSYSATPYTKNQSTNPAWTAGSR